MSGFKLSQSFLDQYKGKQPKWGFNGLGYVVYKRSYAKELPEGGTEEFWQTCKRVVEGTFELQRRHIEYLNTRWDATRAQKSAQIMFNLMWEFKFLPPGRGLFIAGTPFVMERPGGAAALLNCAFTSTEDINVDFAEPFCWVMEASAHGIGCGFDTDGAGKIAIVEPKIGEFTFKIEDTREGWSAALRQTLNAYVGRGQLPKEFDYSLIRPFGAPIKSFGGTASGPESLKRLLEVELPMIYSNLGKITSTHIGDTMNAIGKCVIAGGSRRSAEIGFGYPWDDEFINLKNDEQKLQLFRWASNDSIFIDQPLKNYNKFIESISKKGSPGFLFRNNSTKYGRMIDPIDNKDSKAKGANPCCEQVLESREACNIVEIFTPHCETFEEFKLAIKYGYLYAKTVTLIKTPWARTNEIMLRNRRIGLSISGIMQSVEKIGWAELIEWMDNGYKYVQELDKLYSDWLCIPRSIRTTTVKPSGSVSLLAGTTPGIHYSHSEYYIRRVEFTKGSKILDKLKNSGYKVEQSFYKPESVVVEFPVYQENFTKGKKDTSIWEQMENAAMVQKYWSDNAISITVELKANETKDISPALERYQYQLKGVSFLPNSDHGYQQAPYEEITKEQYEEMITKILPLDLSDGTHEITDKFCDGDSCQIR